MALNPGVDAGGSYRSVDLRWHNIRCSVPSSTETNRQIDILKGVSGRACAGEVTAFMGPSGAGKSTLIDILACRRPSGAKVTGDISVNGSPADEGALRASMCYVMQTDYLPYTETVRECLLFNAALRLPARWSAAERRARVDDILSELELEDCADTLVGSELHGIKGISGGQMRRLTVAQELLTSPAAVFLDEPTSGLDSEIAISIVRTLAALAARGKTIVLTVHQPNSDITDLFDEFVLLARGRVVYAGPWREAVDFFARVGHTCPQYKNPTDFYMNVISRNQGAAEQLALANEQNWAEMRTAESTSDLAAAAHNAVALQVRSGSLEFAARRREAVALETAPVTVQALHLTARSIRMWRRHPVMILGEGIQYLLLSVFIGGMYFGVSGEAALGTYERGAASFTLLVAMAYTPPFTAITMFNSERGLLRRETNQRIYGLNAYYFSKTATLLPIELAAALMISVITYYMFGFQHSGAKFFNYFLIMYLSLVTAESLGFFFALFTSTETVAILVVSLATALVIAFTGFLTPDTPPYYSWIEYLSFLRYANCGLFINEMTGLTLYTSDGAAVDGETLMAANALDNGLTVWENIAVLAGMFVALRLAGLVGIHLSKRLRIM